MGSFRNVVHAMDGTTGAVVWKTSLASGTDTTMGLSSPAIGADGTIYICSFDNSIYALNGQTGI